MTDDTFKNARALKPVASLAHGVTAQTYHAIGRAFIAAAGEGFVIARHDVPGHNLKATPRQWGAWRGYLDRIGYRLGLMDRMGYYTVPIVWPHLFDAGATIAHDYEAADDWETTARIESQRYRSFNLDAAARKAGAKRWYDRKPAKLPDAPPERAPTIDVDLLMESHAIDTAEVIARTQSRQSARDTLGVR